MRDAKAQADAGLSEDEQGGIHYWDSVAVNHVSFDRHLLKKKKKDGAIETTMSSLQEALSKSFTVLFSKTLVFPLNIPRGYSITTSCLLSKNIAKVPVQATFIQRAC